MTGLADRFDVLMFDLDGVVYIGPDAVPGAVDAIERATKIGARCVYVTNNAARTAGEVAEHLRLLGIPADDDDVVTSSQAGARLVAERVPAGSEVLAVGGPGVAAALTERGLTPVAVASERTAAVMQGYGPEVGWRQLADATFIARAGKPWIATNLDLTFPTPRGPAPGNGSLVQAVMNAAGRGPDAVAGKPQPALLTETIARTGAQHPLMIGDRLDTDIAAGSRLGVPTLLVLTGVCSLEKGIAATGEEAATYIAADLEALWNDAVLICGKEASNG